MLSVVEQRVGRGVARAPGQGGEDGHTGAEGQWSRVLHIPVTRTRDRRLRRGTTCYPDVAAVGVGEGDVTGAVAPGVVGVGVGVGVRLAVVGVPEGDGDGEWECFGLAVGVGVRVGTGVWVWVWVGFGFGFTAGWTFAADTGRTQM